MKKLLALLFFAACTPRAATGTVDASTPTPTPTPTVLASEAPELPPVPLATDGGLAALLAGSASVTRLPVTPADDGADINLSLRSRLTTDGPRSKPGVVGKVTFDAMPPTVAAKYVTEMRDEVRRCYQEGLRRDPTLQGKLVVTLTATSSTDADAKATSNTGLPAAVTSCVEAAIRYNAPEGTQRLIVPITLAVAKF